MPLLFLNSYVKHWPILIILACYIGKKLEATDCSFRHLTLMLSLHYFVKCRSRTLAIDNNEFILRSARIGSKIIN